MMTLEKFLLNLPAGTLRKSSYAWFGVVVIYPWSPLIAALLGVILLLCLSLLTLHNYAWEQREDELPSWLHRGDSLTFRWLARLLRITQDEERSTDEVG